MEAIVALLVGVLFAAHWLLTFLCQLRIERFQDLLARDRFGLIPRWNFFAPIPGGNDYHCLVRMHFESGAASVWEELQFGSNDRPATAFLWNPDKRARKALFDAVSVLSRLAQKASDPHKAVPFSVPYIALLTAASVRAQSSLATGIQFMVMQSAAGEPHEVVFVSGVHDCDEDDA